MNTTPLTPADVHEVTFDKAPFGRRGYHEDQVDDFLDRIEATLTGADTVTADEVKNVEFDASPIIKRGYHEEQVDLFLDRVITELERRERGGAPAPDRAPRPVPAPAPTEQTSPMLFALPPSLRSERAEQTGAAPGQAGAEPAGGSHLVTRSAKPGQPAVAAIAADHLEAAEPAAPASAAPDLHGPLGLPLPPPPPGERGYRSGDVEKLARLLARTVDGATGPTAAEVAATRLSRTFFNGQGYHPRLVDAVVDAWVAELKHREA